MITQGSFADKIWSSVSGSKIAMSLATSAHVKFTGGCIDTLVQPADVSEAQKRKLGRLLKHGKSSLVIDESTNEKNDLSEFIDANGKFVFKTNLWTEYQEAIDAKKSLVAPFFSKEIDMTLNIQVEGVDEGSAESQPNPPTGLGYPIEKY